MIDIITDTLKVKHLCVIYHFNMFCKLYNFLYVAHKLMKTCSRRHLMLFDIATLDP